jgi:hypothetical protein
MAYTIEQQYSRDIDWYFKDRNDSLIHVASGGGRLPPAIEESDDFINALHSAIMGLPAVYEIVVNPILEQFVQFETTESRDFYLTDFVEMAKRGLISVDKTILGNFEDTMYHVVAHPKDIKYPEVLLSISNSIHKSDIVFSINNYQPFDVLNYFKN